MSAEPPAAPAPAGKVEPFIPASQSLPELTVGVIILGSVLSVILAAANAYLGMFAGMTVSASIPAAVVSMAVLRLVKGNILQNNGVQTAAASGAGLAAGVIFTLPAMILLGTWAELSYLETTMVALFGGVLGVLFTIPLRRALIIEQPLQFPEGVATAEVLKVGARGGGGIGLILGAGLLGAVFKVGSTGLRLFEGAAAWGSRIGGSSFYVGSELSPALLAVGFIVGLNVAVVIFAGAVFNRWIAIPLISGALGLEGDPIAIANQVHGGMTRYLGVGAMLVGGLWSLIKLRGPLITGVRGGLQAVKRVRSGEAVAIRTERDIPMNVVLILIGLSVIPLFGIFYHFTDGDLAVSAVMAIVMLVAGFLFSAVSSYMAGLVGSSNNPVSGITISTILISALLLLAMSVDSKLGPAAAILIGGVVCCAAAIGGDNLQDLKCGQLVGSTPWKQQTMQIIGVIVAAFAMAPVLNLLHDAYTIGSDDLPAPQASLMASVSQGVFEKNLPWNIILVGAVAAIGVIMLDVALEKAKSTFRVPVMAFAVGVYLPFDLSTPILLGGIVAWMYARWLDKRNASPELRAEKERTGLLFAAGLITGEALMGIVLAIPIGITRVPDALQLLGRKPVGEVISTIEAGKELPAYIPPMWPGMLFAAIVLYLLYWVTTSWAKKQK